MPSRGQQAAAHRSSPADWGALRPELLALVLQQLSKQVHAAQADGLLSLREAARLLAAGSPDRHWRAAALAEVQCRLRLDSAAELERLTAAPLPCRELQLPLLPPPTNQDVAAQQEAEERLQAAALDLLGSAGFVRHSSGSLAVLRNCPIEAAESGLLSGCSTLQELSLIDSSATALQHRNMQQCPPNLQRLALAQPVVSAQGCMPWPANLQRCSFSASESSSGKRVVALAPCACVTCGAGFWGTLRTLEVAASGARGVAMIHSAQLAALSSCCQLWLSGTIVGMLCADTAPMEAPQDIPGNLRRALTHLAPALSGTEMVAAELEFTGGLIFVDGSRPPLHVPGTPVGMFAGFSPQTVQPGQHHSLTLNGLTAELSRAAEGDSPILLRITQHGSEWSLV